MTKPKTNNRSRQCNKQMCICIIPIEGKEKGLMKLQNREKQKNIYLRLYSIKILWINAYLTVCSYHVTHAFQSEFTLCSCLDFKELLARNRRNI